MKIKKLVFSYDRPIQLQGLCASILHNTDLRPSDLWCLCRSSSARYRAAYEMVGQALGVQIVHENRVVPRVDLRRVFQVASKFPRGRRFVSAQIYRLTTPTSLPNRVLALTEDTDYVSLAVDDMVYFRPANFARAAALLADDPEICLWSWRIGLDRYPQPTVEAHDTYWRAPHRHLPLPYSYVFHTDGSLFRRGDLERWLAALPNSNTLNLNMVEGQLWKSYLKDPAQFHLGPFHAGPLQQSCVTWQINRVSPTAVARFHAEAYSDPSFLLSRFLAGARLDYSPLYGRDDWLARLNADYATNNTPTWTHVAPTVEAVELWYGMVADAR